MHATQHDLLMLCGTSAPSINESLLPSGRSVMCGRMGYISIWTGRQSQGSNHRNVIKGDKIYEQSGVQVEREEEYIKKIWNKRDASYVFW